MHQHPQIRRNLALMVHVYTAMGLLTGFLAIAWISSGQYRAAFLALFASVVIDATDGTLARAVDVRRYTPWINGRKLDDIVDYLNYTLAPIFLIWHAHWTPEPRALWCSIPLVTSAFAFVHEGAKEEDAGFFRGFPSYWNIVAFYIALFDTPNPWVVGIILGLLGLLSILPVRFVYPNRPPCWKIFFLGGACLWGLLLLAMLIVYPDVPNWLVGVSYIYPVLYGASSIYLDWRQRRQESTATSA
ncbi:MAG: phosphatidylcholine synthase [Planctomycetaceae bacterium]|nr:phosphatidylcholine synthase [Planctomycetaceae bacterium]